MADHIIKAFSLDRGIEQILRGNDREGNRLPANKSAILPSDDHPSVKLKQLFKAASLDDHILSLLKPILVNKNILIPSHYQATLRDIQKKMRQAADKKKDKKGAKTLKEAADLLEEEKELLELVNSYRNILHQA